MNFCFVMYEMCNAANCKLNIVFEMFVVDRRRNKVCKKKACSSVPFSAVAVLMGFSVVDDRVDDAVDDVRRVINVGQSCNCS